MKQFQVFLLSLLFLLASQLISQEKTEPAPQGKGTVPGTGYNGTKPYEMYPLAIYDPRIRLKHVGFIRRHADTGRGEFLDVQIDLESRVPENHNYTVYVIAAYERDKTNDSERQITPYPEWRKFDPQKEDRTLYFSNVVPNPVTALEIWGEELYNRKKADVEKLHWKGFEAMLPEPTLNEMVDYLCSNPAKGLPITLYGESGPPKDKVVVYNYIAQTPDEKKRYVHETLPKHTFTIYNNKYQTSVTTHHYTEYRPNFFTFNKVAILIMDPNKKTNALLFRRFIDISDLKITY